MGANTLTNSQLAKEVKRIRLSIDPVINLQCKEILVEVERRLKGETPLHPWEVNENKSKQRARITKKDRYNKYYYQ